MSTEQSSEKMRYELVRVTLDTGEEVFAFRVVGTEYKFWRGGAAAAHYPGQPEAGITDPQYMFPIQARFGSQAEALAAARYERLSVVGVTWPPRFTVEVVPPETVGAMEALSRDTLWPPPQRGCQASGPIIAMGPGTLAHVAAGGKP